MAVPPLKPLHQLINGKLDLGQESAETQRHGLEFVSFPIPDRGTPASVTESRKVLGQLGRLLNDGKQIGIHCHQGIGRSALLAAALLILAGIGAEEAWRRVEAARGCPVPDTAEQKTWVERISRSVPAATLDE